MLDILRTRKRNWERAVRGGVGAGVDSGSEGGGRVPEEGFMEFELFSEAQLSLRGPFPS